MLASPTVTRAVAVVGLAIALTAGGSLLPSDDDPGSPGTSGPASDVTLTPGSNLSTQIEQLQTHLAAQPGDARSWAALSLTLVEQARVTADPSLYPRATAAAGRSLAAQPAGNDLAVAAQATLAAAQHRFTTALRMSRRALDINQYSAPALAIQVDALTELGRSASALKAAEAMDAVQPGLASSTRLAYQAELRGHQSAARRLFRDAAVDSNTPEATAFVEYHLAELARQQGDFNQSLNHYRAADDALPGDVNAAAGRAALLAESGHVTAAIGILRTVVTRVPLPQHVIALGELLEFQGDDAAAREQYAVVEAMTALAADNGVRADLELAQYETDHGDPAAALAAARREWQRRQAPTVADALGWSLHVAGRDRQALPYAKRGVSLGGDARAWHHLGTIQAEIGRPIAARRSLRTALSLDHGYPLWQQEQVRLTLDSLDVPS